MRAAFILLIRQKLEEEQSVLRQHIVQCLHTHSDLNTKIVLQQLTESDEQSWPELLATIYSEPLQQLRSRLERVEAALSQIQIGQYGSCSDCEKIISSETLLMDPTEQRCAECKKHRRY